MKHIYNDGGRGTTQHRGDCVVRAIAIATERPYAEIRDRVNYLADEVYFDGSDASAGVHKKLYKDYLRSLGWVWTATMHIGSGCKVHLREGELPMGRLLVSVSRHLVAVIDGVIHDTHDCSRNGTRCVYGYWKKCCNFKKVHYRTDYPTTDDRAYTEVHAKGCLTQNT